LDIIHRAQISFGFQLENQKIGAFLIFITFISTSVSTKFLMTAQNECAIIVTGESQNLQLSGEVHTLCDLRLSWAAKGTTTPL
jgi:hypothetical protein